MTVRAQEISSLVEKMESPDKDFRFMAVSDLIAKLQTERSNFDENTGNKVVNILMKLVEDTNSEVQNLAVKALGPLVCAISLQQTTVLIKTLCSNIESHREESKDVSSVALKTVVAKIPNDSSKKTEACIKLTVPKLTEILSLKVAVSIKVEILDILSSVLQHHGKSVSINFEEIERTMFEQLEEGKQVLRNRAVSSLGVLASVVSSEQFNRIVQKLLSDCAIKNKSKIKNSILVSTSICRMSSLRFSQYLPQFVPKFLEASNHEDEELKELSLQAFEMFISQCASKIKPFLEPISRLCISFLQFDPNYTYEADTENDYEVMDTGDSAESEVSEDLENESEDDDDVSWKIRRASAKCISALISFHPELLFENITRFGPFLISRFKEHENSVKYEIFNSYIALLKGVKIIIPEALRLERKGIDQIIAVPPETFRNYVQNELKKEYRCIFWEVEKQIPLLVSSIQKQLKASNMKTVQNSFDVLLNLIEAFPGALLSHLNVLMNSMLRTFKNQENDIGVKINALKFMELILLSHDPSDLRKFVSDALPFIVRAIGDPFYKLSAEGLNIVLSLFRVFDANEFNKMHDFNDKISQISKTVISKLKAQNVDQEVRERAILALGRIASVNVGLKSSDVGEYIRLLLDQLKYEATRCVALKSLNILLCSPRSIDVRALDFPVLCPLLACFLRKNEKSLQVATLMLLLSIVKKLSNAGIKIVGWSVIIDELPGLLDQQDFTVTNCVLELLKVVVNYCPSDLITSFTNVFDSLAQLVHFPVMQGDALNSVLDVFKALARSPMSKDYGLEKMVDKVSAPLYDAGAPALLHRQIYISIARTVATIVLAFNDVEKTKKLIGDIQSLLSLRGKSDSRKVAGVLTLGEIGRIFSGAFDSPSANAQPDNFIISMFDNPLEDVKASASYALGSLASGNLKRYLPLLLDRINDKEGEHRYLYLQSFKEVISSQSSFSDRYHEYFDSQVDSIWLTLLEHSGSDEEGICSLVAECMGKMCMFRPEKFLCSLLACAKDESVGKRKGAIVAIRFVIADRQVPNKMLQPIMGLFLEAVRDRDLSVRRAAIMTMSATVQNHLALIEDSLPSLLPALYSETIVKRELVREVEMGPFKHVIDSGLDLRKAAFECMYTVCEQCIGKINVQEYANFAEHGLQDQHDIQLLTFLIIIRLSQKCPVEVSERIDRLCGLIMPILKMKPKPNAVKQENERQNDLKLSAMKVLLALQKVSESEESKHLSVIMGYIKERSELASMLLLAKEEYGNNRKTLH